jgi:predicted TIM-barrel fold metal-dependent hydrolase
MTAAQTGLIDCDVHTAVPGAEVLYPYLSEHWPEYLDFTKFGQFVQFVPLGYTYPSWSKMLATNPQDLTLDAIQSDVLENVDKAILYCHYGLESFTHPYLAPELAAAVNQWLRDEWLDKDPRLLASIHVAPQFPEAAAAEIARAAEDPRFVQVVLPARAEAGYGHQRYWPILKAAAEADLVVSIYFGGSVLGISPTPSNWMGTYFEDYVAHPLSFQTHMNSLIFGGVFDEWPALRIVMAESGWTWLPGWMWRLDWEWRQMGREVPWVRTAPSTYVRKHFRFTLAPTDAPPDKARLLELMNEIAADQMEPAQLFLYSSDYPHKYGETAEAVLDAVTPAQAELIRSANADGWYRLSEKLAGRPVTAAG